ncbi:MAG TPA: hypothetical protein VHX60_13140 [Acidobacteriaceae bacterium]|jgi:hypothetical protein|nr:hypothetical protein [Acidobacteriaceae bacterium]
MNTIQRARRVAESGKIDPRRLRKRVDFSHRFLLFIPVETRRSRRALVIGYYLFFLAFAAGLVWLRGLSKYDRLLPMSFYMATILGGLTFSGPVRIFSEWQRKFKNGSAWGIDPNRPHPYLRGRPLIEVDRLDEHDIALRDRAHYLAYSALRWPAIAVALFGGIFLFDASPEKLAHLLLILSVPVAALFFSLPQAIILWTEPDLEPDLVDDPQSPVHETTSGAHHA